MWHVSHGEKQFGPFSEEKMHALIKAGKLPPSVYVWTEGMADWVMLQDSSLMKKPPVANITGAAAVPPVAANPFDFTKPAASQQPGAGININVAPQSAIVQPTAQQLANPYYSDFSGHSPAAQPAGATANPNFRLLPLAGRQLFVVATTAIAMVMTLVCAWFTFQQTNLLNRIANGGFRNNPSRAFAEATASDKEFLIVFLIYLVALLMMYIAMTVWFYRAHVNAKGMAHTKFEDTSGMATAYFYIPIMSLFKPFVGMRDIWRGSFTAPGSYAAPSPTLVGLWWAAWLLVNFLNRFLVFSFKSQQSSISEIIALNNIAMIGNILMVIPLGLTIMLVTKITAQQARKALQLSQGTVSTQQKNPQPQFQMPQF